jgi:iron-sulfur cluster assembly accessory protein
MFEVTTSAIKEIKRIQRQQNKSQDFCRLQIKKGGCSGLYYLIDFPAFQESDDILYEQSDIKFLLSSYEQNHLKNLKLDYSEDLVGGTFRFENPLATMTCRCGISFA